MKNQIILLENQIKYFESKKFNELNCPMEKANNTLIIMHEPFHITHKIIPLNVEEGIINYAKHLEKEWITDTEYEYDYFYILKNKQYLFNVIKMKKDIINKYFNNFENVVSIIPYEFLYIKYIYNNIHYQKFTVFTIIDNILKIFIFDNGYKSIENYSIEVNSLYDLLEFEKFYVSNINYNKVYIINNINNNLEKFLIKKYSAIKINITLGEIF